MFSSYTYYYRHHHHHSSDHHSPATSMTKAITITVITIVFFVSNIATNTVTTTKLCQHNGTILWRLQPAPVSPWIVPSPQTVAAAAGADTHGGHPVPPSSVSGCQSGPSPTVPAPHTVSITIDEILMTLG